VTKPRDPNDPPPEDPFTTAENITATRIHTEFCKTGKVTLAIDEFFHFLKRCKGSSDSNAVVDMRTLFLSAVDQKRMDRLINTGNGMFSYIRAYRIISMTRNILTYIPTVTNAATDYTFTMQAFTQPQPLLAELRKALGGIPLDGKVKFSVEDADGLFCRYVSLCLQMPRVWYSNMLLLKIGFSLSFRVVTTLSSTVSPSTTSLRILQRIEVRQ
jgi:hypothetical protein